MPIEITAPRITLWTCRNAGSVNLVEIKGRESLSRPYRFRLKLRSHFADPIDLRELLGAAVRASFTVPDPHWISQFDAHKPAPTRDFCGILSHVFDDGRDDRYRYYTATMRPKFWTYGLNKRFRVFQHLDTQAIVTEVLGNLPVRWETSHAAPPRNYCVQYGESDLTFVNRLLEEDGLFYFFEHQYQEQPSEPTQRTERLVITDSIDRVNIGPAPEYRIDEVMGGNRESMRVRRWRKRSCLTPQIVRSLDRHFQRPSTLADATRNAAGQPESTDWSSADYPSGVASRIDEVSAAGESAPSRLTQLDALADTDTRLRIERLACLQKNACGAGDVATMRPGEKFVLLRDEVPDADQYYLTDVQHLVRLASQQRSDESANELVYRNRFRCVAESAPYRPSRRTAKPIVSGVVPATVVSDPSITEDDVCVDAYGRVKVVFPWQSSNAPSCWIRVSQFWAGKRWGAFFWPRTGHEVLVAFEHGDPDRPVIVGSVYNSENMPPLPLPSKKLSCGIHSCTHKGIGTSQTSSMVFHDGPGEEYLALHSETYLAISSETSELKQSSGLQVAFKGHHWMFDMAGGSGGGGSNDATGNDDGSSGAFKDPGRSHFDAKEFFKDIFLCNDRGEIEFTVGDSYQKSVGRHMETYVGSNIWLGCDPVELVEQFASFMLGPAGSILCANLFGAGGQGMTLLGRSQSLQYGDTLAVNRGIQFENTGPSLADYFSKTKRGNMEGYEPVAGFACLLLTLLMLLTDIIATLFTKAFIAHKGDKWNRTIKFDEVWTLNILPRLQGMLEFFEGLTAEVKTAQKKLEEAAKEVTDTGERVVRAAVTTDGAAKDSIDVIPKVFSQIRTDFGCIGRRLKASASS